MNTEPNGIEDMDPIGVQNDGEPVAVVTEDAPEVVETTPAEPKAEGEETTEEADKPHKKTGSQRARERAERETQLRIQAEQERDELRARLAGASAPVADANEPNLEAFEDFASWKAALADYHAKKAFGAAEQKIRFERQRKEQESAQQKWQEADAKFGATKPDWDDAMEDLGDVVRTFTPQNAPGFHAVDMALSDSDKSAELKYHLGKHPDELRRLAAMDPIRAVKELTKIELGISETPQKPKVSSAPPPMKPVSASSAVMAGDRLGGIEDF